MKSKVLLVVLFVLSSVAFAQVVITPQGYATAAGTAILPSALTPPIMVTPIAHLATVRPGTGATVAAPGQQVGATSTSPAQFTPTLPSIVPQIAGAAPLIVLTGPSAIGSSATQVFVPSGQTPMPTIQSDGGAEEARFDFGLAGLGRTEPAADARSLGEVASSFRRSRREAARTYTDQDIFRLNQQLDAEAGRK